MDGYKLKNNDVIRVQFTLYGTGLDISGSEQGKTIYTRADKSKLLEKLAYINQAPEEWLITQEDKDAYDRALEVAQTLNASQTSVNNALNALPETAVIWPQSVVLSSSSLSFYDNDTPEVLSAVIYPEESSFTKIVWSSSDPNVADVDSNGKVTPYKAGQTTITAIAQNGISDSCTVTVSPRPFTSISLDKMSLSMEAGNTYQLQVSGQPSNATEELQLEWSSSDTDVAVVSENGMVTAIGKETANITATKKDTDISSSCQVTVGEAKELAMEAKSLIESLPKAGELTLEDASAVIAAKDAYESLSDISKGYLENRTLLEQKLMRCVSAVQVLQDKYNNVQNVGFLISQIPSLSALSMDDRKTVEEASAAYDSLRTEEKLLVDRTSWSKLENAVSRMEQIVKEVQETNELFAAIPSEISLDDFEIIVAAADAYNALNDSQKQQLSQAVSDKLSTSLEALSELIEKAVRAVDISVTFSQDNTETAELIKAAQVYDNLKDNLDISEEIQEEIAQAKEWVGDGIHEQNGVQADSYWYIKTIAENTTDTSEALNAVKQKYANAQKIAGAWMIFYQDVRTGEYYQQEKNVTVTFSLSNLSNMENPMVFSYIDGNLKEYSTQLDLDKKSISIKSSSSGMFFIADVPIPLTGLDMKSSASVTKGSTLVLSPIRIPENATTSVNYIWKSSDNSIASVSSSGKVTGKKEGTATITVTAEGVKNAVASCKVTVVTKANTLTKSVEDVLKETKDYVLSIDKNPTVGSEWFVLALARNGMALNSDYFATYYNHLANYLEENDGKLTNTVKYTEYSKEILVMTSIGKDARNIAGTTCLKIWLILI